MPSLDGVRGIAVLLVLALHAWPGPFTAFGWAGVDLFFVLSGFLITGVLLDGRDQPHRARTFYIRRALRIMPLYYGVLVLLFVGIPLVHPLHDPVYAEIAGDQFWYWTYLSNWLMTWRHPHFDYVNHFWSLGVEEQFYLAWPLVVWYASRRTAMRVTVGAIAVAVLCRVALAGAGVWWFATYFLTPCRLDALGIGALLALMLRAPGEPAALARQATARLRQLAIVVAVMVAVAIGIDRLGMFPQVRLPQTLNFTLLAVMFGWLIAIAVTPEAHVLQRALQWKPLRIAGRYSYGVYVLHPFVIAYAAATWPSIRGTFAGGALLATASFAAAWISYHGYEQHFLRLKDRLAPVRPRTDHEPVAAQPPLMDRPWQPVARITPLPR